LPQRAGQWYESLPADHDAPARAGGDGRCPPQKEVTMLAMWVKARIKPELRQRFLKAIEEDALGSERDEAGCLRFNVLQDAQDENVYYFYEVYKDQAALEAHRAMPHYAVWRAAVDTLDGPTEATRCRTVFPAGRAYWGKP
jgi:(4S)-4-hydroxy-5-phosphonooxypentane-2,3-dione isomerase